MISFRAARVEADVQARAIALNSANKPCTSRQSLLDKGGMKTSEMNIDHFKAGYQMALEPIPKPVARQIRVKQRQACFG